MRIQDDIDSLILNELRPDSRIPVAKPVRSVGQSRTAVKARLARLERSGQILAYSTREPSTPETDGFGAIVPVSLEVRREFEDFLSEVKAMQEVATCTWMIGNHIFSYWTETAKNFVI